MPEQRVEAGRYADATVRSAVPFDAAFSLESDDALYCTELIWRIYTAATGRDLTPSKHHILGKLSQHPRLHASKAPTEVSH